MLGKTKLYLVIGALIVATLGVLIVLNTNTSQESSPSSSSVITATIDVTDGTAVWEATEEMLSITEEIAALTEIPDTRLIEWDVAPATAIAGAMAEGIFRSPLAGGAEGSYELAYWTEISTTQTTVLHNLGISDGRIATSPGTLVATIIEGQFSGVDNVFRVQVVHRRDGVLFSRTFSTFDEARALFP